jgi:hypothetical protein
LKDDGLSPELAERWALFEIAGRMIASGVDQV